MVSETNIFARIGTNASQVIAYSMRLDARDDLAMILPVPVLRPTADEAVQFIDLSGYPDLFDDMAAGFQQVYLGQAAGSRAPDAAKLEVHRVGSFDASFVPSRGDFTRLDERYRLPPGTWEELPQYADYGFVVFKLRAGAARIHPMAFAFPTRDRTRLFFPTVHIHDGKIHRRAKFDHALYGQPEIPSAGEKWIESPQLASQFLKIGKTRGLVLGNRHIFQLSLRGVRANEDVWARNRPAA